MSSQDTGWDFFISYATEDREAVASPLAEKLRSKGMRVWYDQFELTPGKQLLRSIDEGLRESKFGIVILSPGFFSREWPLRELSGLHSRSIYEGNKPFIIPIWYKLTVAELTEYSPILSDIIAIPWEMGIESITQKILALINPSQTEDPSDQYVKVFTEIYNALNNQDFAERVRRYQEEYPSESIRKALESILLKSDRGVEARGRALEMLYKLKLARTEVVNEILAKTDTALIQEVIAVLTRAEVVLSKEQVHILFANPRLPRSTTGLGNMISQFIKQGADYTSEVFLAGAKYPSWEVKYDCVRSIIRLNDKDALRVLSSFATMSYWKARKTIVEYIRERANQGSLNSNDKLIAENILIRVSTDGKTEEKTPTMRYTQEVLALLQGKPLETQTSSAVSMLFLAADPTDASRLRIGEEIREIQEKLQLAKLRERFELHQRMSIRPADISQALLDVQPQIVHFSGHGMSTGELCFENQIGQIHPVEPAALAALFEQFANQVSCVILNACYSEIQARAIAKYIEYVIGMNQAIGDKAAIAFAVGFYQALGAGRTMEEAYKLGCVQIRLQGIPEHLTPVLIKKEQVQS